MFLKSINDYSLFLKFDNSIVVLLVYVEEIDKVSFFNKNNFFIKDLYKLKIFLGIIDTDYGIFLIQGKHCLGLLYGFGMLGC